MINKNRQDAVRIGANTICKGIIRIEAVGRLDVGDEVYIGDNTLISAAQSIRIGSGTLIAHGVQIFDNTSHPLYWKERQSHFRKMLGYPDSTPYEISSNPVVIGEHCWLGFGCVVLKGVSIGDRSIIGAGTVVTKDIPPDTLVVGGGIRQIHLLERCGEKEAF
jgi:acetyltransferase-like isoleucine patch superfamily enzyme